jgi:transposase
VPGYQTASKSGPVSHLTAQRHFRLKIAKRLRPEHYDSVKRGKQQLLSFLLRHGRTFTGRGVWTRSHFTWLAEQKFEHPAHHIVCQDYINAILDGQQRRKQLEKLIVDLLPSWSMKPVVDALCVMRGINIVAATSILSATGDLRRFSTPTKLGAYFGLVPGEHSSGDSVHRLGITKRGQHGGSARPHPIGLDVPVSGACHRKFREAEL